MAMEQVTIVGTGLIGTSIALALRRAGFRGEICGMDRTPAEREAALHTLAFNDVKIIEAGEPLALGEANVIVLAVPVLGILDWINQLAPILGEHQLVTDVGSTKAEICRQASRLFNHTGRAGFLPGHPMAGRERGGAAMGDAELFQNAMWLFTPVAPATALSEEWRQWVQQMGARTLDLHAVRHDELCAWVSHLPQMLSTAFAALLEERFGDDGEIAAIGGRALGETTRLGASPYSMWRDIAMTNAEPIAATLHALEQRLAHLRENLRTPELRDEFATANRFRQRRR